MDINKLTIHELRDLLRKREISSVEIVQSFFKNIESVEDKINSFITLDKEKALEEAKKIDKRFKAGEEISDIAGIPVAIKDNISIKGMKTTCGSNILKDYIPSYDATVVKKLREQGAIIIGKTNMDEFAMGSSTENSAFKITKNPWDLERVPGGSSGGSAAAVAACQVPMALGSETGGSIRQPAAFCGVVGLKPTYGVVSRYGLVAFASSLDQIGPFNRDVEDSVITLEAISGHDPKDSTSVRKEKVSYTGALVNNIKGLRIGLPKEYFSHDIDNRIKEKVMDAVKILEGLGAYVDEISLPNSEYALAAYYIISSSEASSNLSRFDGVRYGYRTKNYKSAEDLIIKTRSEGFGEEVKRRIMLGTYALSTGYHDKYYKRALKVRTLIKEDFNKIFEQYDVIICPTTPTLPFKIGEKQEPLEIYILDMLTISINLAGICSISIPCGYIDGLPVGMQIIGNNFDEEKIFRVAYTYEKNKNFTTRIPDIGGILSGI